ncbi:MAG TPA: hypothetical protein VFV87_02405, partial [Pirellulaceae bacterium]|nr:hypothetical protein [Pirellulaceae bacterium]
MAAGVADDVVLSALSGEVPFADGSDSSLASRLAAVVDAGRMFAQLATTAKLAVLHSDDTYSEAALRTAGDLCAVVRRIGASAEERYELEALAVRFLLDIRRELAPTTIRSRRECAIRLVMDDGDDELQGSPFDERSIGNLAIAMVDAICAEFLIVLSAALPTEFLAWLDIALHLQTTLYPQYLVELVFPESSQLVYSPSVDPVEAGVGGSWLSTALPSYTVPQRIDLGSEILDYGWLQLTIQRYRELNVMLPDNLRHVESAVTRLAAVESLFTAIDNRIGGPPDNAVLPKFAECAVRSETAARHCSGSGEVSKCQQTLARVFRVSIDEQRKILSRDRRETPFPKGNSFLWQLAAFLLSATEGRTTAAIREKWKEIGGKSANPCSRTIENNVSRVNLLLEPLRLEAGRPKHNGPWTIIDLSPR